MIMEALPGILLIVVYFLFKSGKKKRNETDLIMFQINSAENLVNSIDDLVTFVDDESTTKNVKDSGKIFLNQQNVELYEPRARRVAGHSGVRVAKGVYIGGSSAKSYQEQTLLDTGSLTLYVDELIYSASLETRTIKLVKIVETEVFTDGFRISIAGRQKPILFSNISNSLLWSEYIDSLKDFIQEFNKGKWDKSYIEGYVQTKKSNYVNQISEKRQELESLTNKNNT